MVTMKYESRNGFSHDFSLSNGIVRWNSNNRIPPDDILLAMMQDGILTETEFHANVKLSHAETQVFINEYIKSRENMTADERAEERFELRAAFGPGVKVTNIFTGKTVIS